MSTCKIAWTEKTWNVCSGCDKISDGCKNCYSCDMTKRLAGMGVEKYRDGFKLRIHPHELTKPYSWKNPSLVFVNSMSDLFHKDIPTLFIQEVFRIMNNCPQHTFQVLTKRGERLEEVSPVLNWTDNIWMGVSVESQKYIHRIDNLMNTGAKLKFLSLEPLIGPLSNMNLSGIDWVIVGGESGISFRPMPHEWARDIRNQCGEKNIPFFFKQSAGFRKTDKARLLDGKVHHEFPQIYTSGRSL